MPWRGVSGSGAPWWWRWWEGRVAACAQPESGGCDVHGDTCATDSIAAWAAASLSNRRWHGRRRSRCVVMLCRVASQGSGCWSRLIVGCLGLEPPWHRAFTCSSFSWPVDATRMSSSTSDEEGYEFMSISIKNSLSLIAVWERRHKDSG